MGNLDQTEPLLRRALAIDSTHVLAHNSLGNLHLLRKEFAAAEEAYQQAARFDSIHPGIRRNLAITRKFREEAEAH